MDRASYDLQAEEEGGLNETHVAITIIAAIIIIALVILIIKI